MHGLQRTEFRGYSVSHIGLATPDTPRLALNTLPGIGRIIEA